MARSGSETRSRLLLIAEECLRDTQPEKITGREVAKRAGVSYGLVHHYFPSIEALLQEAFAAMVAKAMAEPLPETSVSAVLSDPELVRALARLEMTGWLSRSDATARSLFADLVHKTEVESGSLTEEARVELAAALVMELSWTVFRDVVVAGLSMTPEDVRATGELRADLWGPRPSGQPAPARC